MFRFIAALLISTPAGIALAADTPARGSIELQAIAETEIKVVKDDGAVEIRRVPAGKVVPGDVVIYTIHARNVGDQPVDDVVITDPIPEHMVYRDGSATGESTEITFSVDGGSSWAAAGRLRVTEANGTTRPAVASDYTHIRWRLTEPLHPGGTRSVEFRARLQ